MARATSKANMDPTFEKRLREMKEWAKEQHEKRVLGEQAKWYRPQGWAGGVLDFFSMAPPWVRAQANNEYVQAVQSAQSPGTTGDVIATTTMIDALATMERSFRQRCTMRRCRSTAHMTSRMKGLGNDKGPLIHNYVEYIRGVLRQTKG